MPTVLAPAPSAVRYTEQEYLLRERDALEKSDFLNGEIIQMGKVSNNHNTVNENLTAYLRFPLIEKGCRTYGRDLSTRVFDRENTLITYPDFVIVCGEPEFAPDEFDNLINPMAIVEILSPSTQNYDLTTKAELYRGIPTLKELIFIAQHKPYVEQFIRKGIHQWDFIEYVDLNETMKIAGCEITLAQIYQLVKF